MLYSDSILIPILSRVFYIYYSDSSLIPIYIVSCILYLFILFKDLRVWTFLLDDQRYMISSKYILDKIILLCMDESQSE